MSLNLTKFLDSRQMKALRTGRFNPPGDTTGNHFFYKLSWPQVHSAVGRFKALQNPSDSFGNQTRDLPACSAVPQTTAPPRTRCHLVKKTLSSRKSQWRPFLKISLSHFCHYQTLHWKHWFQSYFLFWRYTTPHFHHNAWCLFSPWPHFFLHCHVGIFLLEHTEQFIFSPTRM